MTAGPTPTATAAPAAASGTRALTQREQVTLEVERDFLLASIRDLQDERTAGELDDTRYESLVAGYTTRAARVLRALEAAQGQETDDRADRGPPPSSGAWRRRLIVLLALGAVVAVSAGLLAAALGQREPGQTITGNQQTGTDLEADLAGAVAERPDDPAARRAYARYLLGNDAPVEALRQFDAAARLDPTDAESHAYAGWIIFLAGLTEQALGRIDTSIAADPTYPDAHFFRGVIMARGMGDRAGGVTELRRFLELAPGDAPLRPQVEQLVAELEQTEAPSSTSGEAGDG